MVKVSSTPLQRLSAGDYQFRGGQRRPVVIRLWQSEGQDLISFRFKGTRKRWYHRKIEGILFSAIMLTVQAERAEKKNRRKRK